MYLQYHLYLLPLPGIIRLSEGFHDRYPVEDYLDLFDQAAYQIQGNLTANASGTPSQPDIIIGKENQFTFVEVKVHRAQTYCVLTPHIYFTFCSIMISEEAQSNTSLTLKTAESQAKGPTVLLVKYFGRFFLEVLVAIPKLFCKHFTKMVPLFHNLVLKVLLFTSLNRDIKGLSTCFASFFNG